MNEGFNPKHFSRLAQLEEKSFWFQTRNELIIHAAGKYFPNFTHYLEIGCGTGFALAGLAKAFPARCYTGTELFPEGIGWARKRLPHVEFHQMDAREIPFYDEFDLIGSFDVLEHIPEDQEALKNMHDALRQGGGILLIVPQYQWLWSRSDNTALHVRRYSRQELLQKMQKAGFTICYQPSFITLLFPIALLKRLCDRLRTHTNGSEELDSPAWAQNAMSLICRGERALTDLGAKLPFGLSLFVVGKKTNPA